MTTVITLRPVVDDDAAALAAMHGRCGAETRYRRWFAPLREIPAKYLSLVLAGGPAQRSLVAESGEIVGLGTGIDLGAGVWEFATLVEDAWQGQGVGRALLDGLVDELRRADAVAMVADILISQRRLLGMLEKYGALTAHRADELLHVEIALTGTGLV